ncbi:MAG: DUF2007 domain-containing protein [Chloroflexi bacterium]|jgi:hypothetical protein|nr:DUF2007 domain-containing protein [Chloroflexota bacterium]
MSARPELVVVYTSQGPLAAEVARSKLEAEGLQVVLRYEAVGRVLGLTVDGLGRVEVCVHPNDVALAQAILETDADAPIEG